MYDWQYQMLALNDVRTKTIIIVYQKYKKFYHYIFQ